MEALWIAQDVVISLSTIVVVPAVSWWIWGALKRPPEPPLLASGFSWVFFCIISGMAHLNWAYMPAEIPPSVFVLHLMTAVGALVFAATTYFTRHKIVSSLNDLVANDPYTISKQMARIRELTDELDGTQE